MFIDFEKKRLLAKLKLKLAKVDKQHFSKNEFLVFFKLFNKNVLPEKKFMFIFDYFL